VPPAPGIPHALCFLGEEFMHDSGVTRRGNAKVCLEPCRHCEEPTGRANARPMTGPATKQSTLSLRRDGLLRFARNDDLDCVGCLKIESGRCFTSPLVGLLRYALLRTEDDQEELV
jgi:hypothetical protein